MATKQTAKRTAHEPPRQTPDGINIPPGVVFYKILRVENGAPQPCSIHVEGRRVDTFSLAAGAPTLAILRAEWGSGVYRVQWYRDGGRVAGMTPAGALAIDDPAHPPKPLYSRAPAAASKPEAPAPVAAPDKPAPNGGAELDPAFELLRAQIGADGKLDPNAAFMTLAIVRRLDQQAEQDREERYRRWEREDERRRARDVEAHTRELELTQARANAEIQRSNAFWKNQIEVIRSQAQPATDPRLDALIERVESFAEGGGAPAELPPWVMKIAESLAPVLLRAVSPAPPAMGAL